MILDSKSRLISVDVLRGITVALMIIVNTPGSWQYVYPPLLHSTWHGCTLTDLVFPFFMVVVGISLGLSTAKYEGKINLAKVAKRGATIFIIGFLLQSFPFYDVAINNIRYFGVLQRIGLAFILAAGCINLVNLNRLILATILLAILYGCLIGWNGISGMDLESNIVRKVDIALFGPSHLYQGFGVAFDPEGLLSTIGAVLNVLLGYIFYVKIQGLSEWKSKIRTLLAVGVGLVIVGIFCHNFIQPINKPLWTTAYVCFTSGLAAICWALLIYIIDFKHLRKWAFPFEVFGANALISYVISIFIVKLMAIPSSNIYDDCYQQLFSPYFGAYLGSLLQACVYTLIVWYIAYQLYIRKIFIKV